ncbi:SigB/SigF/SigG family RNA polymerase sigma factor [Nocardia sp. CDC159]|uniref:SigB/SigF/SigG family RNA polymerase sigma factor n=1 Tax=Nocardia pulmonis TaxID=2951408 RepID=A0A9X2EEG8_9NOCA|nr:MULTISPECIES: SigB/SigF/SigG family RNA polymerase sigma factor [Nocardia]MCM6778969.1 SigB/SigF/SigG family RNA polymerase sigma factor [Nocardia pulmonis]MCM6791858.1 SigB/SigF/SigG family RNA polymerase sigma factor [Nocardia sp. CDC159]
MTNEKPINRGGRAYRGTGVDSYDNIEPWFEKLAGLPVDDPQRAQLREQILRLCLPLADHIARRFRGRGQDPDDLLQVARVGLVLSVDRFDVGRGSTFLSFAIPTITGEVRRFFRDQAWATHVPRPVKELHCRIGPATEALAQRLHRMPTARELASELGVEPLELTHALVAANAYRSDPLDKCIAADENDDGSLEWTAPLGTDEPGYSLTEEALTIAPLLKTLPERERTILILCFGRNLPQAQIARLVGLSQMHVSRILSKTLRQLRAQAEEDQYAVS